MFVSKVPLSIRMKSAKMSLGKMLSLHLYASRFNEIEKNLNLKKKALETKFGLLALFFEIEYLL